MRKHSLLHYCEDKNMAKIKAPNSQYNGESASVKFENGVGETDDPNLITWFLENGYEVEEVPEVPEVPEVVEPVVLEETAEVEKPVVLEDIPLDQPEVKEEIPMVVEPGPRNPLKAKK